MVELTLQQIVSACGGTFQGESDLLSHKVSHITIDSRQVQPGCLFVPIRGERFDGHQFIPSAYESGAVCALSERPLDTEHPYILVPSTLQAFQDIAAFYKSLFPISTIGITGSVGKTTTKEMISSVLSQQFDVLKSQGNLNNQTGVPLNIFRLERHHQAAVIEMGTNHFGEIRNLAKIVRPNYCFLTNIGEAHIEHLGSKDGILQAKSEMLEYMQEGGTVFINGDDPYLQKLQRSRQDVVAFGLTPSCQIYGTDLVSLGLEGTDFTLHLEGEQFSFHVPAPGKHMVYNALAAIGAGLALHMDMAAIQQGVASYAPLSGRMDIQKAQSITVLNDCYNANPGSMKASLDVLSYAAGRKVCILGDMFELGEKSQMYHQQIGAHAAQLGIDLILCVGSLAKEIAQGAQQEGSQQVHHFSTQQQLIDALPWLIQPGDTILVKASHGMALDQTVSYLLYQLTASSTEKATQ